MEKFILYAPDEVGCYFEVKEFDSAEEADEYRQELLQYKEDVYDRETLWTLDDAISQLDEMLTHYDGDY